MDIDGALERAARLVAGERYREAVTEYENVIRSSPGNERAYCGMILIMIIMDAPERAMEGLSMSAWLRPDSPYPHGVMGTIMEETNFIDEALECYDRMIAGEPAEASAYVRKAQILLERGKKDACADVMRACGRAARPELETPRGAERLRALLEDVEAGRTPAFMTRDDAVFMPGLRCLLDRAVGKKVPSETAPNATGIVLAGGTERAAAIAAADRVLESDPGSAEDWCEKGVLLSEDGRAHEALACYDRAIGMEPGMMTVHAEKIVLMQDAGDRAGMKECLRRAAEAEPSDAVNAEMQRGLRAWLKMTDRTGPARFRSATNADATRHHVARRVGHGGPAAAGPALQPGRSAPPGFGRRPGGPSPGRPAPKRRARLRAGRRR